MEFCGKFSLQLNEFNICCMLFFFIDSRKMKQCASFAGMVLRWSPSLASCMQRHLTLENLFQHIISAW